MLGALTIAGGGTVGVACAIEAARLGRHVVLYRRPRPPLHVVEALPPSSIGLLDALGVDWSTILLQGPFTERWVAWEDEAPRLVQGAPAYHIVRSTVDAALERGLVASAHVTVVGHAPIGVAPCVDATGRRSAYAVSRSRPRERWIARTCTWAHTTSDPRFFIAGTDAGYFYRLGGLGTMTLAFVGPGPLGLRSLDAILRHAEANGAGWLVRDLGSAPNAPTTARVASVQWGLHPAFGTIAIGDAALGKDALSSSGLASGLSDAMYAASGDWDSLRRRQLSELANHLRSLVTHIDRARFSQAQAWARYREWIANSAADLESGGQAQPGVVDSDTSSRADE